MAQNVAVIEVDDVGVRGPPGSSGSGLTLDTEEPYRIIMLSDGSVYAIPDAAVPPLAPTGFAATVRLTSVNLTWTASVNATSYAIERNGVRIGTTAGLVFRDVNTVLGNTYTYTVAAIDKYKQRSPPSDTVTAFIDPALNAAPADVVVTCWPLPIPTDGPAIIRVNAQELDVQDLAFTLGVDAGSLSATQDPCVWVFRI